MTSLAAFVTLAAASLSLASCAEPKSLPPSFLSPESERLLGLGDPPAPAAAEAAENEPLHLVTPFFTLSAPPEAREEGTRLAHALERSIARLLTDYAAADAERLLRSAAVHVRVATHPDEHCGPGQATTISSWNEGQCTAEIHLLAPSAHPDPAAPGAPRTITGEPMDEAYAQRVLAHEYATILLESITRQKSRGWSFWSAPSWFVQGAEEYIGVMYSTARARDVTLERYVDQTRQQSLVTNDWGFEAQSPYISGTAIVAFLHERFGRSAFIAILQSEESTFGRALRTVLGTDPDSFFRLWSQWLEERTTDG